jgi:serine/threonine-protein kinase RsbW
MEQFCLANGISEDDAFNLHLVLDESVINVIVHGYEDAAEHDIHVRLRFDQNHVVVDIDDDGIPYNPLDAPKPRFDLPIEQRRIGGLGVHIMKTLARSIEYKREDGRNYLHIVINVGQDRAPVHQA